VGSNPTQGMDVYVCVFFSCVCVVLCVGCGLYRLCKNDYETEEKVRAQQRIVEPLMNEYMYINTYET
jgi:hypothetical protein